MISFVFGDYRSELLFLNDLKIPIARLTINNKWAMRNNKIDNSCRDLIILMVSKSVVLNSSIADIPVRTNKDTIVTMAYNHTNLMDTGSFWTSIVISHEIKSHNAETK
jgi:hypothetical protein